MYIKPFSANLFVTLILLAVTRQTSALPKQSNAVQDNVINVQPGKDTLRAAFEKLKGRTGEQTFILAEGQYHETVTLKGYKDKIILKGAGGSSTTYKGNKVTIVSSAKGLDDASALAIQIDNVQVFNIDFVNDVTAKTGEYTQAVALTADGDMHRYEHCSFRGYQDTLYDKAGRHVFHQCYIEGSVDFIFGGGRSFYDRCDIGIKGGRNHQVITASSAGRYKVEHASIFVFNNPNIFDVDDNIKAQTTYYGRAWGPKPLVVMQNSKDPKSLNPDGWDQDAAFEVKYCELVT